MRELKHRLLKDVREVGITVPFDLEIRPYSKTYYGRYDPNTNKITVYMYEDSDCTTEVPYKELLLTTIHEAVHCIQWSSESFVRRKGVMHDTEFYRLLNLYTVRAESLIRKDALYARVPSLSRNKNPKANCRYPM